LLVSVDPDPLLGENTGVAIYNPDPDSTTVLRFDLRDAAGNELAARQGVQIGPRQQLVGFVTEGEFFGDFLGAASDPFVGILTVTVTSGTNVPVLGMIQKKEALNSALITIPSVAVPAP
jgi:hypothetical protein